MIEAMSTTSPPSEREKWEREQALKEQEFSLKERELLLKTDELGLKKKEYALSGWKSPLVVAIMAGAVAAIGNAIVTMTNGRLQRDLEDQKSEQTRILEMIKTGDPDKAAENLRFLLDAGLISNVETSKKLADFLSKRKPGSGPTLPSASAFIGNSLAERIDSLKKQPINQKAPDGNEYQVANHVLLDNHGNPVSIVETPAKGEKLSAHKAIVLHCTATDTVKSTLAWFASAEARASTHIVIDRDGKVTQLVPLDIAAWHAGQSSWNGLTGLNKFSIGIDFVNAGKLDFNSGKWKSWSGIEYPEAEVFVARDAPGNATGWQKYTEKQISSAVQVVQALAITYPTIEAILGHSEIAPQGRKIDPGPAFPIEKLRAVVVQSRRSPSPTNQSSGPDNAGR